MNIRKSGLWISATALGAMIPFATALAADMPVKAAPIVAAAYDWSGVYLGVHAGYGGGMKDWDTRNADFVARGFLAGGQVGINKQIASFVFGLELDGSWADISGSQFVSVGSAALGITSSQTARSKIDGLVTIAGRAGIAADRWFVFAKGGITVAHERHSMDASATGFGQAGTATASGNEIRYAPMVGFGAEYALGGNWSVKGEYNYIHLDTTTTDVEGHRDTGRAHRSVQGRCADRTSDPCRQGRRQLSLRRCCKGPVLCAGARRAGHQLVGRLYRRAGGLWFRPQAMAGPRTGRRSCDNLPEYDMTGWLAGGTVGVNAQAGRFVFGVEGEIPGHGHQGKPGDCACRCPAPPRPSTTTARSTGSRSQPRAPASSSATA